MAATANTPTHMKLNCISSNQNSFIVMCIYAMENIIFGDRKRSFVLKKLNCCDAKHISIFGGTINSLCICVAIIICIMFNA